MGPSIPGEPMGIPGTAIPATWGRSDSIRFTCSAGTWPSTTYPSTSAVWHDALDTGTPASRFTDMRSLTLRASTVKPASRRCSTHPLQQPHDSVL